MINKLFFFNLIWIVKTMCYQWANVTTSNFAGNCSTKLLKSKRNTKEFYEKSVRRSVGLTLQRHKHVICVSKHSNTFSCILGLSFSEFSGFICSDRPSLILTF